MNSLTGGEPNVRLRNVTVTKEDKRILDIPRLELYRGEILGVIGPNGAGKSTLLKTMALLESGVEGDIELFGQKIAPRKALENRRRLSFVFQQPLLLDGTVRANVALGLKYRRTPKRRMRDSVNRWLEVLGIGHLADRHVAGLSGGEAQRVSLARAFATDPEIIFLDEPFTSLDPPARAKLTEDLLGILQETGTTAVLVTHDLPELTCLTRRVLVLIEGRIRQIGPPEEVLFRPADPRVARFVGMDNLWPAKVHRNGNTVEINCGSLVIRLTGEQPEEAKGQWILGLRPENVDLLPDSGRQIESPDKQWFSGRLTGLAVKGSMVEYGVELDGGLPLVVRTPALAAARRFFLKPGEKVRAGVSAGDLHLIPRSGKGVL